MKTVISIWKSGLVMALLASNTAEQANLSESFQGVGDGETAGSPGLLSRGWNFRNQSNPNNVISPFESGASGGEAMYIVGSSILDNGFEAHGGAK